MVLLFNNLKCDLCLKVIVEYQISEIFLSDLS